MKPTQTETLPAARQSEINRGDCIQTLFRHTPVRPAGIRKSLLAAATGLAVLASGTGTLLAQSISVGNGSFESPTTPPGFPAFPQIDLWLKTPQPPGIPLPGGVTWDQLAGVFPNTPAGSADHIGNMHGNQAAYILAIPGVTIYQNLDSTYEAGKSYHLTFGILGGGGIAEGSLFEASFFYNDAEDNRVTLATTPITFTQSAFPTVTHLIDYEVTLPIVQEGDAWAGKNIGLQLASSFGTGAGYWDVDNVRVEAIPEPSTVGLFVIGAGGLIAARRLRTRRPM